MIGPAEFMAAPTQSDADWQQQRYGGPKNISLADKQNSLIEDLLREVAEKDRTIEELRTNIKKLQLVRIQDYVEQLKTELGVTS